MCELPQHPATNTALGDQCTFTIKMMALGDIEKFDQQHIAAAIVGRADPGRKLKLATVPLRRHDAQRLAKTLLLDAGSFAQRRQAIQARHQRLKRFSLSAFQAYAEQSFGCGIHLQDAVFSVEYNHCSGQSAEQALKIIGA
jgi:hypothetical protein